LRYRILGSTIPAMSSHDKATVFPTTDSNIRQRIDELENELERYREREREREQLIAATLLTATRHATAIRESARRDAELTLRKASAEAAKRTSAAERQRDRTMAELLRLRRITEQMRNGLSTFLTATVEELRQEETEKRQISEHNAELDGLLASIVSERSSKPAGSRAAATSDLRPEIQHRGEHDPSGRSPDGLA
jgi:hypothetical protein